MDIKRFFKILIVNIINVGLIFSAMIILVSTYEVQAATKVAKPKNLVVYRSQTSALVEWNKVDGATGYKIYRKTTTGKYKYLGKVKEKTYKKVQVDYRQFVDHKSYKYKKKYKYKVVAYKKVKGKTYLSKAAKKTVKRHYKNKLEFGYEALDYVNELRKELGLKIVVWDHTLEQGGKVRAKELATDYSHTRPNGQNYSYAWEYIVKKDFTGSTYVGGVYGENINRGFTNIPDWWSTINAFKNSKGHRGLMTMGFTDNVISTAGLKYVGDVTDTGSYIFTSHSGDIIRNTGSICCVSYQKNKDSSIYYNYSIGSVNKVYTVNGKLYDDFKGDAIRKGKYVFGEFVPYEWVTNVEEETTVVDEN